MAGVPGLSKSVQDSLKGSLAAQSAPPNPQTPSNPADRMDPSESKLLDLQRVRRALQVAQEHMDDTDPIALLVGAMSACTTRLLSRIEISDAVDILLERCFPLASQTLKVRLQQMFAPISPPPGLGGGAQGLTPPNPSAAGGATGQPPAGPPSGEPGGDAGALPA